MERNEIEKNKQEPGETTVSQEAGNMKKKYRYFTK